MRRLFYLLLFISVSINLLAQNKKVQHSTLQRVKLFLFQNNPFLEKTSSKLTIALLRYSQEPMSI